LRILCAAPHAVSRAALNRRARGAARAGSRARAAQSHVEKLPLEFGDLRRGVHCELLHLHVTGRVSTWTPGLVEARMRPRLNAESFSLVSTGAHLGLLSSTAKRPALELARVPTNGSCAPLAAAAEHVLGVVEIRLLNAALQRHALLLQQLLLSLLPFLLLPFFDELLHLLALLAALLGLFHWELVVDLIEAREESRLLLTHLCDDSLPVHQRASD